MEFSSEAAPAAGNVAAKFKANFLEFEAELGLMVFEARLKDFLGFAQDPPSFHGFLEFFEEAADLVEEGWGFAQIYRALAAFGAIGKAEIGADFPAVLVTPGFDDGTLACKEVTEGGEFFKEGHGRDQGLGIGWSWSTEAASGRFLKLGGEWGASALTPCPSPGRGEWRDGWSTGESFGQF
jgi:hypothetical protein